MLEERSGSEHIELNHNDSWRNWYFTGDISLRFELDELNSSYFSNHNEVRIILFTYDDGHIRNIFNGRSVTMCLITNSLFQTYYNFLFNSYNFFISNSFDNSRETYKLKVNYLYLGKWLSKPKYSTNENIAISPKSTLLIIILLLMCGDTGASLNPGPISVPDERYLYDVDPDVNYFNDVELNASNFKSFTINEFNNTHSERSVFFNILHHNCRSIVSEDKQDKYENFLDLLGDPFDIIGLTETWLNDTNADTPILDKYDYNHIHKTRSDDDNFCDKERGGGISLFIRKNIVYKVRDDLSVFTAYLELLMVEIKLNTKSYLIGVTYRVPDTNVRSFIDEINTILEPLRNTHQLILMGDFNICLLHENNNGNMFRNIMSSNSLFPTILEPTRVATITREGQEVVTESLIDNIFVNESVSYNSGIILCDISDHYPVFISIPCKSAILNNDTFEVKFRLIDNFRIRKFKSAIVNNSIIMSLRNFQSAKGAFNSFYTTFNQLYDKYFPIKTKIVTKKSLLKPWVTDIMAEKIKRKHNLSTLAKKGNIDKKTYTDFKNDLTKELRIAKAKYYDNEFTKSKGDIRGTWKIINNNTKKKVRSQKVVIMENDVILEHKDVPFRFIDYFSNIPHKLVDKITPVDMTAESFLKSRNPSTFFMSPIIGKDIESAIKNLKNCNGIHTISTLVLKEIIPVIVEPLAHIFNLCSEQGYFPDELKTGCITPIYKKGDHHSIENYRPVCSLSQFSKIFEKIIYNRMIKYIDRFSILTDSQYGFRANKSTESALVDFTNYIYEGLTAKSHIGAIFMDLSKAFDVMSHDVLQNKLEHYGFRGKFLSFLMSFLKNRKYFVCVNGYQSNTVVSNIGVPQGSTLGPLLFLLYINDIINCSTLLKFILFADDTTLLLKYHNFDELNKILEIEANKVIDWFSANRLIINPSKTHAMHFSNRRGDFNLNIKILNTKIDEKEVVTFLGMKIDRNLTWKPHIDHICSKISKAIAILYKIKHSFPKYILRMIYMSLIYPYINYCNIIWGSAYDCHLNPLIVLQKKAIRLINNSKYRDPSAPIFYNLKLLPISKVFHLNCLIFIYKCLFNNSTLMMKQKILQNFPTHNHATRYRNHIRPPRERLEICRKSYVNQSIRLWNDLDEGIKESKSLHIFRARVKNNLYEAINLTNYNLVS